MCINQKKSVKKINYFVFIIQQLNNHGVSRRLFTETDVKQSGANNHKYNKEYSKMRKRIPSHLYFKNFVHRYRKAF